MSKRRSKKQLRSSAGSPDVPESSPDEQRKTRRRDMLWLAAGLLLVGISFYVGVVRHDMAFFILLFILLIWSGVLYAALKNGYSRTAEQLKAIALGHLLVSVALFLLMTFYLFSAVDYRALDSIEAIETKKEFDATYHEKAQAQDVFVSGVLSKENSSYKGCAVYADEVHGGSIGPSELLVDLKDGKVVVTDHLRYKNNNNQPIRLNWPWGGITSNQWQCLKAEGPISVRGTLQGSRSIDGAESSVSISAEQIYPGTTEGHTGYLQNTLPDQAWGVFMGRSCFVILCFALLGLMYYTVRLVLVWKRSRGQRADEEES